MINKKIMPIEKTKRTVFGIFGKFVADLFNMSISFNYVRRRARRNVIRPVEGRKIRSIILKP